MDGEGHADIHWVRPESKSRAIVLSQIRELMAQIHLKPNDAEYKVAIIVAADRMNVQSANAFLKTLEEPPPRSVIILLTTEPQQLLDTILSRCLRLNFAGDGGRNLTPEWKAWLTEFGENAAAAQPGLLGRYRLLGSLLKHLGELREHIEKSLTERSPLSRHDDVEPETRRHWEEELEAAIEAEYRRQRAEVVAALHWWCRDVWLRTLGMRDVLLTFPELDGTVRLSQRLAPHEALANLSTLERTQRQLATNVQEALALEVGLLKLHL
jgi:DNA polymerase-3 subunit delta'